MKKIKEIDDGVIKFDTSKHVESAALPDKDYQEIEFWREKLFLLKLVGEYLPQKIGYGNISYKVQSNFIITGTQTGNKAQLNGLDYVKIVDYDLEKQLIKSIGPVLPSSESLTHAAIYSANSSINCVFHIHNNQIWSKMLLGNYPKTNQATAYGTIFMAKEVKKLIGPNTQGVIVLEGHEDGVIIYAQNLKACWELTIDLYKKFVI